jgi:hypothetical protein
MFSAPICAFGRCRGQVGDGVILTYIPAKRQPVGGNEFMPLVLGALKEFAAL